MGAKKFAALFWVGMLSLWSLPAGAQGVAAPAADVAPRVGGDDLALINAEREILFQRMLADPANLDVAFTYAALSARAGDVEAAISTLERMLIFAPGVPRLQLELGVLYVRIGAFEHARLYFDQAVAGESVPPEVRAKVEDYLAAIDKETELNSFSGMVVVGVRGQTNANAAPENRTININGLDFLLDEDAVGDPDVNAFSTGVYRYSRDLENQGDRIDVNLVTYGAAYLNHDELNTALAELTAGPVFDLDRFGMDGTAVGIYGIAGGVVMEQDPYLSVFGVGAFLSREVGAATQVALKTEFRSAAYYDSDRRPLASDRSGEQYRGSATLQHQLNPHFTVYGVVQTEREETEQDYLDNWELEGRLGGMWAFGSPIGALPGTWSYTLGGGYLHREFDEADIVIDDERQGDDEIYVDTSLVVPLAESWALQATAGYRQVTSNYDIKTFDNAYGSLGVMKKF
jgi:hypothetical protein